MDVISKSIPPYYWYASPNPIICLGLPSVAQIGLHLDGCLYLDNHFEKDGTHQVYDQWITFNQPFFMDHILPQLEHFTTLLNGDNDLSQSQPKRTKSASGSAPDFQKIFLDYLKNGCTQCH